jgi:hypothetical protein
MEGGGTQPGIPFSPGEDTPGDAAMGVIGQRIEQNGVGLTVLAVERAPELDGFQAEPGQTFVIADVRIENGSEGPLSVGMIPFELSNPDEGIVYINAPVNREGGLRPNTLERGEQAQGLIAFQQVDAGATNLVLSYQPLEFIQNGIEPIRVSLSDALPPAAEAATPAAPVTPGDIGQQVERNGVTLMVLSANRLADFEGAEPSTYDEFVVVDVFVENLSSDSVQIDQAFRLEGDAGNVWTPDLSNDPGELTDDFLDVGAQAQGRMLFDIPATATDLTLVYEPIEFQMVNAEPLRVSLGDLRAPVASGPDAATATPAGPVPIEETPVAATPAPGVPTPTPAAPVGVVTNGGNLRSEPRIAPDTVLGQVCPEDRVELLEQQGGWYRIRIYTTTIDCIAERAAVGTEGWVSSTLLSVPTAAIPEATAPPPQDEPEQEPEQSQEQTDNPVGAVNNGGNLRSEPRIAPDTVLGQVCPGDTLEVLEQQQSGGILWYRIRISQTAEDCHPERVDVGTAGWLSSILVTLR